MKFPEVTNPETLEKRYVGKLSRKALSLMSGLLRMEPAERLTALEALAHPYFDGIREPEIERLVQNVSRPIASSHGSRMENSRSRTGLRNQQRKSPITSGPEPRKGNPKDWSSNNANQHTSPQMMDVKIKSSTKLHKDKEGASKPRRLSMRA